jgi:hypothetical protein
MNPLIDDILSLLALAAFNAAVALLLYGLAPDIAALVSQ